MDNRLPYYMAYPMPLLFDDDKMSQRDYEYMKSIYPDMAKKMIPYIEEECDRLEYSGSMLYDEYPDQLQLRLLCRRVYDKLRPEEAECKWIMDLIQVVVYQELCQRRREHRTRRQRYY